MNDDMIRQQAGMSKRILDSKEEYILNGDFILPEYCPDVAVVLKCIVTPRIQSRQWNGEQLMLDGTAQLRVLYLDEERRCLREAEFSQPIAHTVRADSAAADSVVHIKLHPQYINCRATSPRRLEVRSAFQIHASADIAEMLEVPGGSHSPELYYQEESLALTAPVNRAEKILTLNEMLDFSDGLPAAEQLLGGSCEAAVCECKILGGKIIVKGQVLVHQLYTDDSSQGTVHSLDFVIPYSQILDMEGAGENTLCRADVSVTSDDVHIGTNGNGENKALAVNVRLLIQAQLYERAAVTVLSDAFHANCPVDLVKREVACRTLVDSMLLSGDMAKSIDLPNDQLKELLDVWVYPQTLTMSGIVEEGKAQVTGRITVCMLVRDTDDIIGYYERAEECQRDIPVAAAEGDSVSVNAMVSDIAFTAASGKLQLRLPLQMTCEVYRDVQRSVIADIQLQEDQPFAADRSTVRLYYAEPGERIWEIAKSCHASPEAVRRENGSAPEVMEKKTVLLIPVC